MGKKVTKVVISVAGDATRFLPQTKAMPKQMLLLVEMGLKHPEIGEEFGKWLRSIKA